MADVSNTLAAWSSTTDSNSPSGATNIGTGLDNNLREIQGVVVRGLSHKGSDIASSTVPALGATEGLMHDITGTAAITGFDTVRAGILKVVKFEGILTLTHNATNLILPSAANITTAVGDTAIFFSEGSGNWRCVDYQRANGRAVKDTLPTRQILTSGTAQTYTTPSGAVRLKIRMVGAGGGGGGFGGSGGAGGASTFNSIDANGGAGGTGASGSINTGVAGGAGGTGGSGSADFRFPGAAGGFGDSYSAGYTIVGGGNGGATLFGGNGVGHANGGAGTGAVANTGSGGGGTGGSSASGGGGGGAGEYLELTINNPSATYTYTVGAAGTAGAAGGVTAGGAGAAGVIIVEESYI